MCGNSLVGSRYNLAALGTAQLGRNSEMAAFQKRATAKKQPYTRI